MRNRLKNILQLMDKIRDMMSKKKYISALKNLNQLSSHHLIQLQEYSVSRKIWDSLPSLRDKITKQVNSNFDEWMHSINKQGKELGKLAFHQTKNNIEYEEEERENLASNDNNGDTQLQQIQLQQKFGLFIGDNNDLNAHNIEEQEKKANDSNISTLFEKIENLDFNAIYQCIHIQVFHQSLRAHELVAGRVINDIQDTNLLRTILGTPSVVAAVKSEGTILHVT